MPLTHSSVLIFSDTLSYCSCSATGTPAAWRRQPLGDSRLATAARRQPLGDSRLATAAWRQPLGDSRLATAAWRQPLGDSRLAATAGFGGRFRERRFGDRGLGARLPSSRG